jgi:hypothetical protein
VIYCFNDFSATLKIAVKRLQRSSFNVLTLTNEGLLGEAQLVNTHYTAIPGDRVNTKKVNVQYLGV